jgi:Putative auto-transporter adhesin, head GIN domain
MIRFTTFIIITTAITASTCCLSALPVPLHSFAPLLASEQGGKGILTSEPEADVVESRAVTKTFTTIEVDGGGITVEVTCKQEHAVQVIGEVEMVRGVETEVEDGRLIISGSSWRMSKKGVVVRVSLDILSSIEMSGANVMKVVRVDSPELDVEMSGACVLDIAGKVKKLSVEASGACVVNAKDLLADRIFVEADGASKAVVSASHHLCATVSGVSKIVYYGEPKNINKDVSGLGKISQMK